MLTKPYRKRSSLLRVRTTRKGFSFVELIIIIAIVAILAAILFPIFARSQKQAHGTACLSNERQIGSALIMYSQDSGDMVPFYFYGQDGGPSEPAEGGGTRYKWMDAIFPYVKNEALFDCPEDSFPYTSRDNKNQVNHGYHVRQGTDYGSYLINCAYRYDTGHRTPPTGRYLKGLNLKAIAAPATTIWVADATAIDPQDGSLGAGFGWTTLSCDTVDKSKPCHPQPKSVITQTDPPQIDRMIARHQGMSNVIYCDGHARAVSLESIVKPKSQGGTMLPDGTITALTVEDD